MSQVSTRTKAKQPTKAELLRLYEEAQARADKAEAALLAKPATATPANGRNPQALQPEADGVVRLWLMVRGEGYRVQLVGMEADGRSWSFTKWSNGNVYHLWEPDGGELHCDCPGGAAHGPSCANGRGCKHARMLRAVRQLVDPGL
jgi:hypothetical protein